MDKTIREDSESPDPKQGDADLTIREEGSGHRCNAGGGSLNRPFLESCLIAVAGSLFPNLLLNIQGVTRKTD
jgi:hypothetical protein